MRHGKVLVVDDEPTERDGLARLVGQWGYEVETAGSGEEALSLVESQRPAVVVTVLVLPEMDGLTLLEKLKETGRPPIVLLVTGQGTVETAVEAMRRGALDYLTKPVDTINCAAIPETLIESELFGHERGAFTGATERRLGCFELADGGTLFLDEIAEMDSNTQAKLPRVLQDGSFRHVGGVAPETEKELERYSWPGNVRELRNVIQRAVVLSGTGLIASEHLPDNVLRGTVPATGTAAGSVTPIREMERDLILRALEETGQDKRKAAQLLGISLKTLYNKLAKYGIQAVKSARLT